MAVPIHEGTIERLEMQAKRIHEVVGVLAKYRLAGWIRSIPLPWLHPSGDLSLPSSIQHMSREERIRLALTELGTTYIKLGQMLSTRPDLVGPELANELSRLQSGTTPDPARVVKARIRKELGKDPAQLFARFESRAFASASIAQVHRATLKTGEQVVVKVQKQGIREKVEEDLSIMATLAELIEKHSEDSRIYHPVQLVDEFRRSLMNELDFTRERHNLDAFNRNFEGDPSVRFPRAWPDLSTRVVLTMDFLDGILGTDIEDLRRSGADLREFARKGAAIYLDMIFRDSFYHADPHPGNLMLLADNVVGIIDCGMVGRLDPNLHDDFEGLLLSMAQADPAILADTLWKLSKGKPAGGRAQLQADLSDLLAEATEVSVDEIDMGGLLRSLTGVIQKYKISLRPALTQLLRTLVLLEGTSQRLDPKFGLGEVIKPYCEKLVVERFAPERIARRLARSYRDWERLLETLPHDLEDAIGQIQTGGLQVRVDLRNLDTIVNRLVLGLVLSALLLGSSLLWSLKAPPLAHDISVFGAAGYFLALGVGWILLRSMQKSGRRTRD